MEYNENKNYSLLKLMINESSDDDITKDTLDNVKFYIDKYNLTDIKSIRAINYHVWIKFKRLVTAHRCAQILYFFQSELSKYFFYEERSLCTIV